MSNLAVEELDHSSGDFQYRGLLTNKSGDSHAEGITWANTVPPYTYTDHMELLTVVNLEITKIKLVKIPYKYKVSDNQA